MVEAEAEATASQSEQPVTGLVEMDSTQLWGYVDLRCVTPSGRKTPGVGRAPLHRVACTLCRGSQSSAGSSPTPPHDSTFDGDDVAGDKEQDGINTAVLEEQEQAEDVGGAVATCTANNVTQAAGVSVQLAAAAGPRAPPQGAADRPTDGEEARRLEMLLRKVQRQAGLQQEQATAVPAATAPALTTAQVVEPAQEEASVVAVDSSRPATSASAVAAVPPPKVCAMRVSWSQPGVESERCDALSMCRRSSATQRMTGEACGTSSRRLQHLRRSSPRIRVGTVQCCCCC